MLARVSAPPVLGSLNTRVSTWAPTTPPVPVSVSAVNVRSAGAAGKVARVCGARAPLGSTTTAGMSPLPSRCPMTSRPSEDSAGPATMAPRERS